MSPRKSPTRSAPGGKGRPPGGAGKGAPDSKPAESILAAYRAGPECAAARALVQKKAESILGGLSGGSLPFFLAAVEEGAEAPAVVLTASEEEAEELREELATFAGEARLFPAWESLFLHDSLPDGETYRDRLETLLQLSGKAGRTLRFIVAPVHAAIQPVPPPAELAGARRRIAAGDRIDPTQLARDLDAAGFRKVPLVEKRGEFSLRGDIFDFFPYDGPHAVRCEFFADTIEAIRAFRPETQKSIPGSEAAAWEFSFPGRSAIFREVFRGGDGEALIFDHLPPASRIVLWEPHTVFERAEKIFRNLLGEEVSAAPLRAFFDRLRSRSLISTRSGPAPDGPHALNLGFGTVERFRGVELPQVIAHLADRRAEGFRITVWCENSAEAERFVEILRDNGILTGGGLDVEVGPIRRGFAIGGLRALVLAGRELFNRQAVRRARKREAPARPIQSFLELAPGDFVVHLAHGIGRFRGMETFEKEGVLQEFLALEFRGGVVVYVPVSKIDLVQKYIGSGAKYPVLDKVGGASWGRKKDEVEKALVDFASDLLEVQAIRKEKPGISYPPDTEWQRQFEASFPFEETPDQIDATLAIKRDMESPRPMDRLLCGDVGYGKTELAIRAAFKAANAGRQVAMLVPTTVLAEQHYRTFRERMAEFPMRIDVISRFRTAQKQRQIVEEAAAGRIDILIGTHRILSGDVNFPNLGLVIIDEEQRFGVAAKEKLKRFRSVVDILTLTATPIPRTLHMSLLGIRDISNLTTPPEGRSPVVTEVMEFDRRRAREIFLRELNRDGQIYFVHNRIQDIERVQWELSQLVPEARIEHGHGQMSEDELEAIMVRFIEGRIDVLVSTTIIESGLDIPNVNTIFINEADRYGLADLHQLRGRVGRGKHQAYCYLVLPEHRHVNPDARKRIQALKEFAELGAGFAIAMRDLEIRGAGNILGLEQSGHIAQIGYEMYCRLLEKTVKGLRKEEYREPAAVELSLNLEAFIPDDYLPGRSERLEMYRRISTQGDPAEIRELAHELEDRFGEPPAPARRLLEVQELRALAAKHGVTSLSRDGNWLVLRGDHRMKGLIDGAGRRAQVLNPQTARVSLDRPRGPGSGGGAWREKEEPNRMSDEQVFRAALEWFRTGALSEPPSVFKALKARAASRDAERDRR